MANSSFVLPVQQKSCQICGAEFSCGDGGQQGGCWCMDLPITFALPSSDSSSDCFCPNCLKQIGPQDLNP